jgi:hypothetical protein
VGVLDPRPFFVWRGGGYDSHPHPGGATCDRRGEESRESGKWATPGAGVVNRGSPERQQKAPVRVPSPTGRVTEAGPGAFAWNLGLAGQARAPFRRLQARCAWTFSLVCAPPRASGTT